MVARRLGHVPALDGIRGIALLLVLWTHLDALYGDVWWTPRGGFLTIDLFFVLSGFLITTLLLQEHASTDRIRLGAFYVRRGLRILPALWVFLVAHLVFVIHATKVPYDFDRAEGMVRASFLYVTNFYIIDNPLGHSYPDLTHLWSLSVEEHFYVLWPLVLIGLLRLRRERLAVVVLVATIAVIAANRFHHIATWPDDKVRWYVDLLMGTQYRVDSILVGALAGWLWSRHRSVLPIGALATMAWCALGFIVVCMCTVGADIGQGEFAFFGGYTLFAIATAIIILACIETPWAPRRAIAWAPFQALGKVSYGAYLWHNALLLAIRYYFPSLHPNLQLVVFLGATTVAGLGSWFLVERPALRLKRRFERRPVTAGTAEAPAAVQPATLPTT